VSRAGTMLLLVFWLLGLVHVLSPKTIFRFYKSLHGAQASGLRLMQPRDIRRAGVVWLIVMSVITIAALTTA
jgi:hypothetical protein